jgi:hypothetical protein
LGSFLGRPQVTSRRRDARVLALVRRPAPVQRAVIYAFNPAEPGVTTEVQTASSSRNLEGFGVLECDTVGMFTEGPEQTLFAFHSTIGLAQSVPLGHPGGLVYADPFRSAAFTLAPRRSSDGGAAPSVRAFDIVRSGTAVSATERSSFSPPLDLVFLTAATRYRESSDCE